MYGTVVSLCEQKEEKMKVNFEPAEIKKHVHHWRQILLDCCDDKIDNKHLSQFQFNSMKRVKWVRHTMVGNRKNASYPEQLFAAFLFWNDIDFIPQAPFYITNRIGGPKIYFSDFYLPKAGYVIELDGKEHNNKRATERDEDRDFDFLGIGIKTLRVSNAVTFRESTIIDFPFLQMDGDKMVVKERVRFI